MSHEIGPRSGLLHPTRRQALWGLGGGLLAGPSGLLSAPAFAAGQTVAFVPKFTSDPYFVSANQGAQEAGKELGLSVQWLASPAYGPRTPRPTLLDPFTGCLRERVVAYPGLSGARLL